LYPHEEVLKELWEYAEKISLPTEIASELVNNCSKTAVIIKLTKAIRRNEFHDQYNFSAEIISTAAWALGYDSRLVALSQKLDCYAGLQPIRLIENEESNYRMREGRKMLRMFLEQKTKDGELSVETENDASSLKLILGLSDEDFHAIFDDVQQKAYRMALREKFISGQLDMAKSKALVLNDLCYRLNLSEHDARRINNSIFKQRLKQLVSKGVITDADEIELEKLRVLLCIKEQDARETTKELCGTLFREAVQFALGLGMDTFESSDVEHIKKKKS
jgi:hypothetical protein